MDDEFSSAISSEDLVETASAFDLPSVNSDSTDNNKSVLDDLNGLASDKPSDRPEVGEYEKRKKRQMLLEAMWESKRVANGIVEFLIEKASIRVFERSQLESTCSGKQQNDTTSIEKMNCGDDCAAVQEGLFSFEDDTWLYNEGGIMFPLSSVKRFKKDEAVFGGIGGGGGDVSISGKSVNGISIADERRASNEEN